MSAALLWHLKVGGEGGSSQASRGLPTQLIQLKTLCFSPFEWCFLRIDESGKAFPDLGGSRSDKVSREAWKIGEISSLPPFPAVCCGKTRGEGKEERNHLFRRRRGRNERGNLQVSVLPSPKVRFSFCFSLQNTSTIFSRAKTKGPSWSQGGRRKEARPQKWRIGGGILYGLIYEECLLEVAGQLGKRGRERKGCSLGGMAERAKLSDAASVGNGHLPLRLWQLRKCSLIQKNQI